MPYKKITFFNAQLTTGGVPRVLSLWGNYFVQKGFEVEVVSNIPSQLIYNFDKTIKYSVLGIDKFKQRNKFKTLYKIYKFLKKRKNEILIFNKSLYIFYLFILKKIGLIDKSLKLVYFAHGGDSDFKVVYNNLINYMIVYTFDEVIALHNDYDDFKFEPKTFRRKIINFIFSNQWENIKKKINYIPNPVTFRSEKYADYNSNIVLAVGRLDYIKGFDLLIKAWQKVSKQYPDWELKIVGGGEEENNLKNLINKLFLKNVKLVGAKQDIKSFYLSASIYVMSSREEGMPMVLVEAMECGLPIVAFANVGAKFLVKDKANGFLCEIGDIENLSNNIINLIENKNLREKMGKKSKELVKDFYIENLAHKWNRILNG